MERFARVFGRWAMRSRRSSLTATLRPRCHCVHRCRSASKIRRSVGRREIRRPRRQAVDIGQRRGKLITAASRSSVLLVDDNDVRRRRQLCDEIVLCVGAVAASLLALIGRGGEDDLASNPDRRQSRQWTSPRLEYALVVSLTPWRTAAAAVNQRSRRRVGLIYQPQRTRRSGRTFTDTVGAGLRSVDVAGWPVLLGDKLNGALDCDDRWSVTRYSSTSFLRSFARGLRTLFCTTPHRSPPRRFFRHAIEIALIRVAGEDKAAVLVVLDFIAVVFTVTLMSFLGTLFASKTTTLFFAGWVRWGGSDWKLNVGGGNIVDRELRALIATDTDQRVAAIRLSLCGTLLVNRCRHQAHLFLLLLLLLMTMMLLLLLLFWYYGIRLREDNGSSVVAPELQD